MKRKEKVLLGAKKKRSGDDAPLWSRALHFLLALVPRKRFLERVEVGLNLQISVQ